MLFSEILFIVILLDNLVLFSFSKPFYLLRQVVLYNIAQGMVSTLEWVNAFLVLLTVIMKCKNAAWFEA